MKTDVNITHLKGQFPLHSYLVASEVTIELLYSCVTQQPSGYSTCIVKETKVNLSLGHVTKAFMRNISTYCVASHMEAVRGIAWSALCTVLHWRAMKRSCPLS